MTHTGQTMKSLSLLVGVVLISVVTSQGTWSSIPTVSTGMWNSISPASLVGRTVFGGFASNTGTASSVRPPVPRLEQIIGSSIIGRPLRMGELGLPRHGGAGAGRAHADGTRGGWDGNPATLGRYQHDWVDPLGGRSLPFGWNGDFRSISHLFR